MLTIIGILLAISAFFKAIYVGILINGSLSDPIFGETADVIIHFLFCICYFLSSVYLLSRQSTNPKNPIISPRIRYLRRQQSDITVIAIVWPFVGSWFYGNPANFVPLLTIFSLGLLILSILYTGDICTRIWDTEYLCFKVMNIWSKSLDGDPSDTFSIAEQQSAFVPIHLVMNP